MLQQQHSQVSVRFTFTILKKKKKDPRAPQTKYIEQEIISFVVFLAGFVHLENQEVLEAAFRT